MYDGLKAQPECYGPITVSRAVTVKERLIAQKQDCEQRLDRINKSLAFLDKNPELEEFMTSVHGLV